MPSPARLLAAILVVATPVFAQVSAQKAPAERLDAADHAIRMARIAVTGDLGLPPLLPVLPDSPRDAMYFADRLSVAPDQVASSAASSVGDGGAPQMVDGFIPPGPGGTGTDIGEVFKYQIPGNYDPLNDPVPMVIGYHGFGNSANSVALVSTLDEEANARGWFYMSPTGIDDVLFGSPVCQQNVEAAMQFMLDSFNIDPDRLYMVGFSMGGGVSANFAARHRDPDGIMIAALGIVSGTFDWTLNWNISTPAGKDILENEYNFGGTPFEFPWAYQRSSSLYFEQGTYPPLPGVLDSENSMAINLGSIPTYVTWDLADPLPEVVSEEPVLVGYLASLGGTLVSKPKTGTPLPIHSWIVLDEPDLFSFLDGKTVNRTPAVFEALLDGSTQVSWAQATQQVSEAFSRVSGVAVTSSRTLTVTGVENADVLATQVELAGILGPADVHVSASSGDTEGFALQINDLSAPPAWLEDPGTGALLPGTESDPFAEGLLQVVPDGGSLAVDLVTDADYTADLSTSPEPALIGETVNLTVAAPGAAMTYLLLGFNQALSTFKGGHHLLVQLGPTTLVIGFHLGLDGTITLPGEIPNDPQLAGIEVLLQGIMAAGSSVHSISNLWVMDIG